MRCSRRADGARHMPANQSQQPPRRRPTWRKRQGAHCRANNVRAEKLGLGRIGLGRIGLGGAKLGHAGLKGAGARHAGAWRVGAEQTNAGRAGVRRAGAGHIAKAALSVVLVCSLAFTPNGILFAEEQLESADSFTGLAGDAGAGGLDASFGADAAGTGAGGVEAGADGTNADSSGGAEAGVVGVGDNAASSDGVGAFAAANNASSSANGAGIMAASIGDCFVWTTDEGRDVLFKVLSASTVQVGSGATGYSSAVNAEEFVPTVNLSYTGAITIPETVDYEGASYTVVAVADNAFASFKEGYYTHTYSLSQINLPQTVTSIGKSAFVSASLSKGVAFPQGSSLSSIGENAFESCGMTSFDVPASVTTIGASAFASSSLSTISFPGDCALTRIPESAFRKSSLASISIPASVRIVDAYAFAETKLTSIEVPSTVRSLGESVFRDCERLVQASIADGSSLTEIPSYTFSGCAALASFAFPSFIQSVERGAFAESGLTSVFIPTTLTYLGQRAFADCSDLQSVEFEEGHKMLSLSNYLFQNCTELSSVVLPQAVRTVGEYVFSGCAALASISFPGSVRTLGGFAFQGCTGLQTVEFLGDASALSAPTSVFFQANKISAVVYRSKRCKNLVFKSSSPTVYCTVTFYNRQSDVDPAASGSSDGTALGRIAVALGNVPQTASEGQVFDGAIPSVPAGCLWKCEEGFALDSEITDSFYAYGQPQESNLKVGDTFVVNTVEGVPVSYTITRLATADEPGQVFVGTPTSAIGRDPAVDASTTGSITLPSQVTAPDAYPYTVDAIAPYAFSNCSRFITVTIPSSVTSVGASAFFRCSLLRNVFFEGDAATVVDNGIFATCSNIKLVVFGGKKANVSFGASSPAVYYTVTYYASEHDRQIGNVESKLVVRERSLLGSLDASQIRSGSIPGLSVGYQWHYEDGFSGEVPLTNSCFAYAEGIGFQVEVEVRNGNVATTPCWFKVTTPGDAQHAGTVQVGLGLDGITAVDTAVSGKVIIPSSITDAQGNIYNVESVSDYAFGSDSYWDACVYLSGVVLPVSVKSIGSSAFKYCTSIETATLPASLTTLGDGAFYSCTSLAALDFSQVTQLANIPEAVFCNCVSLTGASIPASVESIGASAFQGCLALRDVAFAAAGKLATIGESAFASAGIAGTLLLPDSVQRVEGYAFYNCGSLELLSFPDGIRFIGTEAFGRCASVGTISFRGNARQAEFGSGAFDFTYYDSVEKKTVYGKLGSVIFYGKKASGIANYIETGTDASKDNDYGRAYRFYYNVKFYNSQSDVNIGKASYTRLVLEDAYPQANAPSLPDGAVWRCEDGFSLDERAYDSFSVVAGYDLSRATISGLQESYAYTGDFICPVPTVTWIDGRVLVEGVDYVFDTSVGVQRNGYANNYRAGTASIYLLGIGDFAGMLVGYFNIEMTYDAEATLKVSLANPNAVYVYDGQPKKPAVVVEAVVRGQTVPCIEGEDYQVSYTDNVNAGTASVVVTGLGAYGGTTKTTFTILPCNLASCSLQEVSTQRVGNDVELTVSLVSPWGEKLVEGVDYELTFVQSSVEGGTLILKGIGNYRGVLSRTVAVAGGQQGGGGGSEGGNVEGTGKAVEEGSGHSAQSGLARAALGGDELVSPTDVSAQQGGSEGGSSYRLFALGDADVYVEELPGNKIVPLAVFLVVAGLLTAGATRNRIGFCRQRSRQKES